jgi:hypothetical protein
MNSFTLRGSLGSRYKSFRLQNRKGMPFSATLALVYPTAQCHNPQDQNVTILRLRTDNSTARCVRRNVREILCRLVYAPEVQIFRMEISVTLVCTVSLLHCCDSSGDTSQLFIVRFLNEICQGLPQINSRGSCGSGSLVQSPALATCNQADTGRWT